MEINEKNNGLEKDESDIYMEPFKYLEQISDKNRSIFNELLRYTNAHVVNNKHDE